MADELIDVAVIVGQQDPGLDFAPVAAGVVDEPPERVIDPHRIEQGQRQGLALRPIEGAVRDLVPHQRQERHREVGGEVGPVDGAPARVEPGLQHVGIRNLLPAQSHLEGDPVIGDQRLQLAGQVVAEESGVRDRGRVGAGGLKLRGGAPNPRQRPVRTVADPQFGVAEGEALGGIRGRPSGEVALQGLPQRADGSVVELDQAIDRSPGIRHGLHRPQFPLDHLASGSKFLF